MTTRTLPNSTSATETYTGSGVTLVNAGVQGAPGESGLNYGFIIYGNNDTVINNGFIYGQRSAVYFKGTGDSLINAAGKKITATLPDEAGVYFYYSGSVTNYGVISGYANGAPPIDRNNAILLTDGGVVTNAGTLSNGGVQVQLAAGTIINSGVILGNLAIGAVTMNVGGIVTNLSGGLISGNGATEAYNAALPYGVWIKGGAATVTNAGTIIGGGVSGTTGYAVRLGTGFQNRIIVDPGAVFKATVSGGTAADATLELASSASKGTLSGFGTQFTNFGTVTFDPAASWSLKASTSISSSVINGFAAGDTIDLTGFVALSGTFASNTLVLTNASSAHTTLHIQGSLTTSNFVIGSDGSGGTDIAFAAGTVASLLYGQTIDEAGIIATSETVAAGVLTLKNGGGTAVGTITVGTSLSSGDFTLKSDGAGGTHVIVDTVFGTYASGVTLLVNPTTIAGTASVIGTLASASGVSGPAGTAWVLTNQGHVSETGAGSYGISFASAGAITNAASGSIAGGEAGIILTAGGSVTNQLAGTISGYYGITAPNIPATVVNAGVIAGNYTTGNADGVYLAAGGSVTNQSSGTIIGHNDGIRIAGASGTVDNLGVIKPNDIPGQGGTDGVYLANGGLVTNGASGGTASTAYILGYQFGVQFGSSDAGTLTNFGTISGNPGNPAVMLTTGTIINGPSGATGALIEGGDQVSAVLINGAATVVNYAKIIGVENPGDSGLYYGVRLGGPSGSISNLGANALIENYVAIYATDNDTVTNAGTIASNYAGGHDALVFGGGTNRLIIDPGATFVGTVSGSGPVTLAPSGNIQVIGTANGIGVATLELASASGAGTLSGLGTEFVNFANTTIDANANWTFSGANALVAGATLINSGTLTDTGTLINAGTLSGNRLRLSGGALTNQASGVMAATYIYGVAGGADAVINRGSIGDSTGSAIYLQTAGSITNYAAIIAASTAVQTYGVAIHTTGTVSNLGTASLIEGHAGVQIRTGGTVINAGTIASNQGVSGVAVDFVGGNARLIDDPGAVFIGSINGGSGGTAVMELASGSSAGTISGLGGAITNFTSLVFDAGAHWTVGGNNLASGLGTLGIAGFAVGDTIDLTGFAAASETFASNALVLTLGGTHETLHVQGVFGSGNFALSSDGSGGTDISFQLAPAIVAGGTVSFAGGGSPMTLDSGLTVTDLGGATLVGATISIGSGFLAGDTLNFTTQNGITGTFDGATGTLTLSGTASVSDYQAALDSIGYSFSPADGDPNSGGNDGSRTIDWLVNDGTAVSNAGTSTLHATFAPILHYGQTFDETGLVATSETVAAGVLTLKNGASPVGTIATGISLSSGDFSLTPDGSGGTDVIVHTATGTYANGVTLLVNPTTIASTATIGGTGGSATGVTGPAETAWVLINHGRISETGGGSYGISFASAGAITNAASGTIGGGGFGIYLSAGGTITNQTGGAISGGTDAVKFKAGFTGRLVDAPGATFTGTVDGGNTAGSGSITTLELTSGASAGTLSGLGTQFIDFATIAIDPGASWRFAGTNAVGTGASLGIFGTLTDTGSLTNAGTIEAGLALIVAGTFVNTGLVTGDASSAVSAASGGVVSNSGTGVINGSTGSYSNSGIAGTGGSGVYASGGGVTNQAVITGGAGGLGGGDSEGGGLGGIGVAVVGGGLTNTAQGTITGGDGGSGPTFGGNGGVGVYVNGGGIINQGVVTGGGGTQGGSGGNGVDLVNGAIVTNQGTITGGDGNGAGVPGGFGVTIMSGTLIDAGVIAGGIDGPISGVTITADAVNFGGSARLILDPGASFSGSVAANTAFDDILELASGDAGTLAGLGTSITNFASLVFDSGAQWTVAGNDLASGLGTLGISGFTFGDTIDLTGFVAATGTFASDSLVLTNTLGAHATLAMQGSFVSGNFNIAEDGSGTDITFQMPSPDFLYGQTIDEAGVIATSETVSAGVMTLNNGGGMVVGTIAVGTSLSSGAFTLNSDGAGGTDVIVSTVFGTYVSGVTLLANPTTIASTASITGTVAGATGVYGPDGTAWVLTNQGLVSETAAGSHGISFSSGGTIANAASGTIIGGGFGIDLAAGGSVTNQSGGTISGAEGIYAQTGAATVVNAGGVGGDPNIGIYLKHGGAVTNQSSGAISGGADAVKFGAGYAGRVAIAPGATFSGTVDGGNTIGAASISTLELTSGASAGTLSGLGTQFIDFARVTIDSGSAWTLGGVNSLAAGATLSNAGTLAVTGTLINSGTATGNPVTLSGGTLTNLTGGMLTATYVFSASRGINTVLNLGTIIDSATQAIDLRSAGDVGNAAGALISGAGGGVYVANGAIVNDGTILSTGTASQTYGVAIHATGTVSNLGTASLIEGNAGVQIGTDGTVINAGTIASSQGVSGVAVDFVGGNARLIDDPGAVFIGSINGGSGGTAVMELASSSSAGTISGFDGTGITNFTSLVFDPGADWTVAGSGAPNGLGTLGIAGFAVGDTIDLTGFAATSETFASNALVLTQGGTQETLNIQGAFGTRNFALSSDGDGGTDIVFQVPPSIAAGGTVSFAGGGSPVILDSGLTAADTGSMVLTGATIAIGSGFLTGDTLNFTTQNGITGTFDGTTGTLTLSGAASVLNYQAALDSISYSFSPADGDPNSGGNDGSRTIEWVVNDGSAISNIGTSTLDTSFASILHYGQTIDETGIVAASETVAAGVMTLTNAGSTVVGTIAVGTSLSSGDFVLRSDGSGGTDVIVSTVFGTYTSGVTLLVNPTTIASSALVGNPANGGNAISGPSGTAWSVTNLGTVSETGTAGFGISLASGGTVVNAGAITGSAATAVYLGGAGSVTNRSGGTIAGNAGVVFGSASNDTLIDRGTIIGTGGTAVSFGAGNDLMQLRPSNLLIQGGVYGGAGTTTLAFTSGASIGTLTGAGAAFVNFSSGTVDSGANWVLAGSNTLGSGVTLTDGGTLSNAGVLLVGPPLIVTGTFVNAGLVNAAASTAVSAAVAAVSVLSGGIASNSGTGAITGGIGAGSVTDGVGGTGGIGVGIAGGSLTNQATINGGAGGAGNDTGTGGTGGIGVDIAGGGVSNASQGLISGGIGGNGVADGGNGGYGVDVASGSLTNQGTIIGGAGGLGSSLDGSGGAGVNVAGSGAAVTNQGTIIGGGGGVGVLLQAGGTLIDSGFIGGGIHGGSTADAVSLSNGASRLILDPGASFDGAIVANPAFNDVLELASGGSAGTLSGFGSAIVNFTSLAFDPDAQWTVAGNDSSSGLGTLAIGGFADGDTIDLTGFVAASGTFASNVLVLSNDVGAHETLHIQGDTFTSGNFHLASDGNGGTDITLQTAPPIISGIGTGLATSDEATLHPFADVSITDVNAGQSESVIITLSSGGIATHANGTLAGVGLSSSGIGTYTLTAGSPGAVTTELEALVFTPTAHQVAPGGTITTGFTLAVTDTLAQTATNTSTTVIATAVNDAPSITGTTAGHSLNDDTTDRPFSGVTIGDPDVGASETVTITLADDGIPTNANGTLAGVGLSYSSTGTYTLTAGTPSAVTTELEALVFTPTAHQVAPGGTVTTGMTLSVTDGIVGSPTTDTSTTVIATAANDAPSIIGTTAGHSLNDDATDRPFSGVTIGDPDVGASETVTITLADDGTPTNANGTLAGVGLSYSSTGTYTLTAGSPGAVTTELEALVFTPTAHQVAPGGTITTGMTLSVTDGIVGSPTTDTSTTVIATAVNDAPSITGTTAGHAVNDDDFDRPFSGVTIDDPDVGASETVTITLADDGTPTNANGTLAGVGLSYVGTGIYTLTAGTPSAVTSELEALAFIPTAHQVAAGGTVTTGMTLSVTDGIVGSPTTDSTTTVIATATAIVPCFAAGTRIATPRGAIPVERLREGDTVLTFSGKARPVQWIGRRTLDCNRHIAPERVKPIRIAPHAFGENRPRRALLLSPDHSIFIEDVFIPVKHLVNGTTVTQIDVATVTYYHVELPNHDVVLAEGLPTETYLETGGRFAFANGGGATQLHPDFAPDEMRVGMVWRNFSYAPLIGSDGQLERVRVRLACQALMLGYQAGGEAQPGKKRAKRS
jgi:hypothetical protein